MATSSDGQPRSDLIERVNARLQEGFYEQSAVIDRTVELLAADLQRNLDSCPVGEGNAYRDRVRDVCEFVWSDVFDKANTQVEISNCGARIDIEFPIRLESLLSFPLLVQWVQRYGATSIFAEVKNEKRKAVISDAKQIVGDLAVARRGKVGFLVTRRGFTLATMRYLGALARCHEYLVLPLSHQDLGELIRRRLLGATATMEFLRIRQGELLQAA